ncbi:MAG: ABC transporter permease [Candidatus Njordarchaeia archaeon]
MDVGRFFLSSFLRRRGRLLTTVAVIALLVSMIVGVTSATDRSKLILNEFVSESTGNVDIVVSSPVGILNGSTIDLIKSVEGVENVEGVFVMWGFATSTGGSSFVKIVGVSNNSYFAAFKFGDNASLIRGNNCIMSSAVFERLKANVGDEVEINAFNLNYSIKSKFVIADYYVWEKKWKWEEPSLDVYVSIEKLWSLMGKENVYTSIYIYVENGQNVEKIADEIRSLSPSLITSVVKYYGPNVEQVFQSYNNLLIYIVFGAFLFMVLIQYINIQEQRREIGILKTIGASGKKIVLSMVYTYAIIGLVGFLAGSALSIVVIYYVEESIKNILMISGSFPLTPTLDSVILGLILAILTPTITTLILAKSITKLNPIEVVSEKPRYETVKMRKGRLIVGIVFIVMGIVSLFNPYMSSFYWGRIAGLSILLPAILLYYLGDHFEKFVGKIVGLPGKVAALFLRRHLGKTIAIVALIAISISFVATTNAVNESYIKLNENTANIKMKYDITLFFNMPMTWNVKTRIMKIQGVSDVLPVGLITTRYKQYNILIAVINFTKFQEYFKYNIVAGDPKNVANSSLAILDSLTLRGYTSYKWLEGKNAYNNSFWIMTEKGNITVKIGAVYEHDMSDFWTFLGPTPIGIVFIADRSFVDKYFPNEKFVVYGALVKVAEGNDPKAVLQNIVADFGEPIVSGMTKSEWLKESNHISQSYSAYYYLIGYVLLLIGLALIVVVEMRIIISHRREIGVLRAIGFSRKKVFATFIIQAILATIIAAIVIVIDLPAMVNQFIGFMREMGMRIPTGYGYIDTAKYIIITVIASIFAAIYPSYKIAKENIIETLKYE